HVDGEVGRRREAVELAHPVAVDVAHGAAHHGGGDVAVRDDDHAALEGGDDHALQPVGEVRRVEERVGDLVEERALLGAGDELGDEERAVPAGDDHREAVRLDPGDEARDLRGAADAVGALQDDELALDLLALDAGEASLAARGSGRGHFFTTLRTAGFAASIFSARARTCSCCSRMGPCASMDWRPNSATQRSYSSRTRPWKMRKESMTFAA